ncbi:MULTISPECIES: TIGR02680 family protein [Rhodococcus]|uniref:TIGR02680 family protein n=1 Tax=Rhodococcus TaxID=1827 RepID=UPI00141F58DA|nr:MULTISPECIES: TIGR02680 family protein [Rhodococcus]MDI9939494.1 TIGR02680 family protein [Rhodococcus sp. IEGM 1351]NHU48267.1 TIGR02680 family protein [Rhodococcus sp. A14]UNN01041.1 TIGR02680 family protein [Rhodococcus opacus]
MTSARFRPTRAGIINLWDYRDQEFSFADGRLVLRGPNGSGKTKALEVLFPFVFDGRIEPRRLNPFAGEERTMKSNLLYRGQESAYSYVWMEFCRGAKDDPEAVTVGIGMRATRTNDKVTRWYFVADGRVGVDFSLLGSDDRPLTKKQLGEQIGTDSITDRPLDYRAAIDARMFGLGVQRYDQLINLILTLRRPQLAKNLDPKGLSQALTDGLRPLDEQLVLEAARSFSDMEEVGRALEGLAAADQAAQSFVGVYAKYLRQQARTDVDHLATRLETVRSGIAALHDAAADRARSQESRAAAEERFTAAERALDQANATLDALKRSTAYEGRTQLDDLAQAVATLEKSTELQAEKARKAKATLEQRAEEHDKAGDAVARAVEALTHAEDELHLAAEDAGITWTALPENARTDQLTAALRGHAEERDGDIRAVRAALATVERAATERTRADEAARRGQEQLDTAKVAVLEAETAVESARSRCATELRSWWTEQSSLYAEIDAPASLFDSLDTALGRIGDDDAATLSETLTEQTTDAVDSLRLRRQQYDRDVAAAEEAIAEHESARAAIESEHDDAPPLSAARQDARSRLTGAPLWRLVRFTDGVDAAAAAGIEAALEAANLLDGWVTVDDALPDVESEQFLVALPAADRPTGKTLADVLEVEQDTGVPDDRVRGLLESIALESLDLCEGPVGVAEDGAYRQGIQRGRHTKSDAEYIGTTARARRRAARITELDSTLEETRATLDETRASADATAALLTRTTAAAQALPRTGSILTALKKVTESAGALRSRSDTATAVGRELDQAIADLSAKEKQLRATASTHRTPHVAREIDSLAAAVRHFEKQGEMVQRCRREHAKEVEHTRESEDRLHEARGNAEEFAEEAAIAEEVLAQQIQRLETLRDTLGAGAEQLDRQLEEAHARIEACKKEQRDARKADKDAGEAIGKAEGAYNTAVQTLRLALTETHADAARLAPYARRDLLELLGVDGGHTWPASSAAWMSAEQLVYRIQNAEGDTPILPPEVDALFHALDGATESVRVSDSARKSTRTALTTALQDFDAQLAVAGQDYRLQWDAPDGVTVVQVQDDEGYSSIGEFAARIASARSDQELLLTESERRILEDALLTGLAQQIHERTVDARELIARMGTEMRERRMSSGNTIGVHWVLADNLDDSAKAISKLLERDTSALGPDELATMRAHFAHQIRTARAAHPERSYPEILASALDYRRWRVFSFTLISGNGNEDRLTVARHSALSGGEQSVSLHLPLFAAAHVMLDSADPHAPRLLALDEAFAGVDDNGRAELLGLSVQFDLDLFMTGFDLWITYGGVPGCAHYDLAHSTAEQSVSATLLVWSDGELLAEHDGTDLAQALGSPLRRRVPTPAEGAFEFA